MKRITALLGAVLLLSLVGCRKTPISSSTFLLDTSVGVTLYRGGSQPVLDGVLELCRQYEQMFSRTMAGSEVDRLNRAQGQPVTVSPEVREVLEKAIYYSSVTDGRYDVTIYPVVELWDFRSESHSLPNGHALQTALQSVGWQNIVLQGESVRLNNAAQVDLGSIAKGYIADRMADYLMEQGVTGAIINLGGDLRTIGAKPGDEPFRIGIQKPFADRDEVIGTVEISGEMSVASSGVYERSFALDGMLYHHILDPSTGYPAETGLVSVTVLSGLAADGDALGTGLFLLGLEQGMALAESLEGVEAVFITIDGREHFTSGFGDSLVFERTA